MSNMLSYRSSKAMNKGPEMLRKFRNNVNKLVKNLVVIWEERGRMPFTTEDKIRGTLDKLFLDLQKVFNPIEKILKQPYEDIRPKTERYRTPPKRNYNLFESRSKNNFLDDLTPDINRRNFSSLERYLTPIPKKHTMSFDSFASRSFSSKKENPLEGSPYSKLYPEEEESFQLDFSVPLPRVEIVNSFAFRAKRYKLRGGRGKNFN